MFLPLFSLHADFENKRLKALGQYIYIYIFLSENITTHHKFKLEMLHILIIAV